MNRKEINEIKKVTGEFYKDALEARKEFLELRLRQDAEIKKIYVRSADRIAEEIKKGGLSVLKQKELEEIERQLRIQSSLMNETLTNKMQEYIEKGVTAGSKYSKSVTIGMFDKAGKVPKITKTGIENMFVRVNKQAVEACWQRTHKGLKLSDRIWTASQDNRKAIANIIQDAVARGQDAVSTARMLEKYVRKDANVLSKYYEGMMSHMKGRVPGDLSYQSLRLVRTETTAAFGQGTIQAAKATPSCIGIKYCLSSMHRIVDICDELARYQVGLGVGVFPVDDPPPYPAHPNTHSYLVDVHATPKDFVKNLKQWIDNPESQPQINKWYENIYKQAE